MLQRFDLSQLLNVAVSSVRQRELVFRTANTVRCATNIADVIAATAVAATAIAEVIKTFPELLPEDAIDEEVENRVRRHGNVADVEVIEVRMTAR